MTVKIMTGWLAHGFKSCIILRKAISVACKCLLVFPSRMQISTLPPIYTAFQMQSLKILHRKSYTNQ